MRINFLRKTFCEVYSKDIYAQFRGVKYATTIKLDSDLTIENFCSTILKNKQFDELKAENKIEYVLNNNYLMKQDSVVPLTFLTKENDPLMIYEDSYTARNLKERNLDIHKNDPFFQLFLNSIPDLKLKEMDEEYQKKYLSFRMEKLNSKSIELNGKTYNELKVDKEKAEKSVNSEKKKNALRLKKDMKNIATIVDKSIGNDFEFEKIQPDQNVFNLPIDEIEKLMKKGSFRHDEKELQKIMDLIMTYFVLAVEKEYPLSIELNAKFKPFSYAERLIPISITNKKTGKIFPLSLITGDKGKDYNPESRLFKKSVEAVHTLKQISRTKYNEINKMHFGIITDLENWKIAMFLRPNRYLEVESSENLCISRTYKVLYNEKKNLLDWVQLTEMLKLFRYLIKASNDELIKEKSVSDERWREVANFKRKVKF